MVPYASTTAFTASGGVNLGSLTVTGSSVFTGLISGDGFNSAFDSRISNTWRGQVNGLASLGADGKVLDEQLSPLAISDTTVVGSETEMLALSATVGDVAIRTDESKSYILRDPDPTILASWAELLSPTDSVISVNGHRGAVTLSADDLPEGLTNFYFTNARMDDRLNAVWRGQANGLASLGVDGKILISELSSIPLVDTYVVSSEVAMLASGATKGDIAVRTDESKTYVLQGADPTVLGNWVEISSSASVTAVNGQTGIVALTTTDITEGTGLYWTQTRFDTALANATTWSGDLYIESGNLGIGISSVSNGLEVLGSASTSQHFYVGDNLYIGYSNGADSDVIYFRGGLESLAWSTTNNRFEASTALFVPVVYATSSLIDTLSLGGGLSGTVLATNDNGQVVSTSTSVLISGYLTSSSTLPAFLNYWSKSGTTLSYTEGNVGIGTASPSGLLAVGTSTADNLLVVSADTGYVGVGLEPAYRFDVGGSARFGATGHKFGVGIDGANVIDYDNEAAFILSGQESIVMRIDDNNNDDTAVWSVRHNTADIFQVDSVGNAWAGGYFYADRLGGATTSPFATLSIAGDSYLGGNVTATGTVLVNRTTVGAPTAGLVGGDGDRFVLSVGDGSQVPYSLGVDTNKLWSAVPTTASHAWFIGTEEKMTLNSSGYLGIGTTSPYAPLSVVGEVVASHFTATTTATSTFAGGIELLSGCFSINGVCINSMEGGGLWTLTGDDVYYLNNVAIGTTSASSRLFVSQSSNTSAGGITLNAFESDVARSLFIDSTGDFRLADSTTDFLTVSSDGRFGLGTTSIAAKLNLAPSERAGVPNYFNRGTYEGLGINAYIDTNNSNLGVVDFVAFRNSTASAGGSQFRFFTQATSTNNPALAMTIDKDGRVGILTTPDTTTKYGLTLPNNVNTGYGRAYTWDTYSDTRIKLNQQPLQYGLAELLQLEPKSFEQHSSRFENGRLILEEASEQTIGLIAQEVYGVIPEAVNPAEDENSSLWGINYDKLTPVIIKAIQELAHKQEEMQAELEESGLKSENIDGLAYVLVHNVQINNLAKFKGETTFEGGALFVNNVNFLASVSFEQRVEFKGGMDIKRGIMIKDKGTGEEYCIFLRDGEEVTEKGNCDQILGETTAAATTTLPTAIPLEMNNGTLMSTSTEATEMVTVESSDPMTATTSSDIVPEVNEAAVIAEVREEEEIETVGTGDSGVAESLEAN
ncbi:MAG TPA: tail fiber domain-containing protein [Candidatus Paceibacterota bacterium]|nr:tail fiber domain-containing protein [Candidatus Paceibacterota bacterium]